MLMAPVRHTPRVLTLLAAMVALVVGFATPAVAAPAGDGSPTTALQDALNTALGDYNNAKGRVDASVARQATLGQQQKTTEARLTELQAQVGTVASAAYRGQRMNMAAAILDSGSPEGALHAAITVQYLVSRDDRQLRDLAATRKQLEDEQRQVAAELKLQQDQLGIMDKKRKDADAALRRAGGGQTIAGLPSAGPATAKAANRNPDGSFAPEGCTINDPTTGGCITPRMLNVYNEARAAGFTHFTSCYRSGGGGEHPKGRACDFSANATTFVDARASGADKAYGDRAAAWFVANASRLGVLYVIWYKQIWHPAGGWKSYSGDGTPAGDHYNHVHVSVQ
jgi:hypothetical protein